MSEKLDNLASIRSPGRDNPESHEVDLNAITSAPLSIDDVAEPFTTDQKLYILGRLGYEDLETFDDLPAEAVFMLEKIASIDINEAMDILKDSIEKYDGDMNVSIEDMDFLHELVAYESLGTVNEVKDNIRKTVEKNEVHASEHSLEESSTMSYKSEKPEIFDWELQSRTEAGIIAFWSIYREVRSVTQPYDDPSIPCETFRVYFIGLLWTVIGTFINQYFSQRQPAIDLGSAVVQLLIFPCGKFLEWALPAWDIKIWKWKFSLNPGPWSSKEQMLATLTYSVSGGVIYVSFNFHVLMMDRYYGVDWVDFGYQILLTLSTNFLGFGLAGIVRKFVVYPATCLWPSILPTIALNKALCLPEKKSKINGWSISSYRFFLLTFAASFVYFWIPDYLFTALSTFNWLTWIAPNNFNLAAVTGSQTGLGINPITSFDWNIINFNGPLKIPFYAYLSNYLGMVTAMICIIGVWWSNYKWTGFLPLNSNASFDNKGRPYQVTAVLNDKFLLDEEKYKEIGPPFYSAGNLVLYGGFFAIYPFTVFYTLLMNFKQIKHTGKGFWKMLKNRQVSNYDGFDDPFSRSMTKYKEVPEWVFTILLVISIVLGILAAKLYPSDAPVWTIFFAIGLNFVFLIPICIVYSTTGFSFGLNVLVELIVGYAMPGNGLGLNFVKAFGYVIDAQSENYITNQKQAHYMRVPPRALFRIQMISVFLHSLVSLGTLKLMFNTIEDYCSPHQPQKFKCPSATTFYTASIFWGVIGPKRVFGGLYPILQWCFLIGFLLVFPCVLIKKYFGRYKVVKYFHPVVFIQGFLNWAPYNLSYYTPGLYASYVFMSYLRKRYTPWWSKYNYILSGGLSGGLAFASIIIFFAVQYHPKYISWWGNNVNLYGLDYVGPARLNVTLEAPDGYFGPRKGHYP